MRVSCIIPFYNEEGRVGKVVQTAVDSLASEVIAVNSASTDMSLGEVKKIRSEKLKIVDQPKKMGKAKALVEGFNEVSGEIVVLLDSDLSGLLPEHIEQLINPIIKGKYDVVINDRKPSGILKAILSGERAFRKKDFSNFYKKVGNTGYGIEMLMAKYMLANHMRIGIVHLAGVKQLLQTKKRNVFKGILGYIKMYISFLKYMNLFSLISTYIEYRRRIVYI